MKLLEILHHYITPIRKWEKTLGEGFKGKDILAYYQAKYHSTPMRTFMEHHFQTNVFPKARTQE